MSNLETVSAMLFKDIIGQDHLKAHLIQTAQSGKVPHALLLSGPGGAGKLPLALAFARYLNCTDRQESDACGHCPSCQQFSRLQHPDLHFVFPIYNKSKSSSKPVCDQFLASWREILLKDPYFSYEQWMAFLGSENAQGLIYAEEGNEILRKLGLKSYESAYKTMIIWLPEKMHPACANRLLKILEEPPRRTVFLLVSEDSESVLGTIWSRSQHLHVPGIELSQLVETLRRQYPQLPEANILAAARLAKGSLVQARTLLGENETDRYYLDMFIRCMRNAYTIAHFPPQRKLDKQRALQDQKLWAEEIAKIGRERQKQYLTYAQRLTRENFIMNLRQPALNYLNPEEAAFSGKFFSFINHRNIEDFMQTFELAERHIEQNVNARMVFFDLALQSIMLFK